MRNAYSNVLLLLINVLDRKYSSYCALINPAMLYAWLTNIYAQLHPLHLS